MMKFKHLESDSFYFFRYDSKIKIKGWTDVSSILIDKFRLKKFDKVSVFLIKKESEDLEVVLSACYIKAFVSNLELSSIKKAVSVEIPFSYIKESGLDLSKTPGKTHVKHANELHYDLEAPDKEKYVYFEKLATLIKRNQKLVKLHQTNDLKKYIRKVIESDKHDLSLTDSELSRIKMALKK